MAFPRAHFAFKGCPWTSDTMPCQPRSCHEDVWAVSDGRWYRHLSRVEIRPGIFGCCGQSTCLREHLIQVHGKVLDAVLPPGAVSEQSFDYYLEVIAYKEQQKMPDVGPAIDRRTFRQVAQESTEDSMQALICMCCAQIRRTCNSAHAETGRIQAKEYFGTLGGISFAANLDFGQYLRK